jgi:hypothetical protein
MTRRPAAAAMFLAACAGAAACDEAPPADRCASRVEVRADAVEVASPCGGATLSPAALVDGAWRGGGRDGACALDPADPAVVVCPAGAAGRVVADATADRVAVWFEPAGPVEIGGLALEGEVTLPGATSWLSNGFQSWSQSGFVALGAGASDDQIDAALAKRGDAEAARRGAELSNWYTLVGGGAASFFAGAVGAERFRPWISVARRAGDVFDLRLVSGAAGERIAAGPGEPVAGEPFLVAFAADSAPLLERYGRALPSRRRATATSPALGWNSWYDLWDGVDEAAVRANAARIKVLLGERAAAAGAPLHVVVDDGWQRAWGDWRGNDKFPSGMDGLASDLRAEGFVPGIWLAPLLVDADDALALDHPEWFLPAEHSFVHVVHGPMRVLDPTHPDAARHLAEVIERIVGWGFALLKIDFLFAGAWEAPRHEAVTGLEAYHRALAIIRAAAGDDVQLLAVGAPPLPSFPHVDSWRLGADIAFEPLGPSWYFAINQGRSLGARWFLCHATLCDPDPPLLRSLPAAEVATGAWIVALAGGGVFLSDDLRSLPQERTAAIDDDVWLATALAGRPSVPIDQVPALPPADLTSHTADYLFGVGSHVLPSRWRTPAGRLVVLNLTEDDLPVQGVVVPPRGAVLLPPGLNAR